jgi:outer membrane lipoprotein SlyB
MLKVHILGAAALALAVTACADEPARMGYGEPHYAPGASYSRAYDEPRYVPAERTYDERGQIVAIDVAQGSGRHTSGAGAVVGGIVGGVLGHQIGNGTGNSLATAAGAVGGAVAGNEIEKRRDDGRYYRITVRFRDGREASYAQLSLHGMRVGDRVRADGDHLVPD